MFTLEKTKIQSSIKWIQSDTRCFFFHVQLSSKSLQRVFRHHRESLTSNIGRRISWLSLQKQKGRWSRRILGHSNRQCIVTWFNVQKFENFVSHYLKEFLLLLNPVIHAHKINLYDPSFYVGKKNNSREQAMFL